MPLRNCPSCTVSCSSPCTTQTRRLDPPSCRQALRDRQELYAQTGSENLRDQIFSRRHLGDSCNHPAALPTPCGEAVWASAKNVGEIRRSPKPSVALPISR